MIFKETRHYAMCPHCKRKDSCIDHLLNTKINTKWYCDNCGGRYSLNFSVDGKLDIEALQEWHIDLAVVLRYREAYVVVKGMTFVKDKKDTLDREQVNATLSWHYEENTCPINWMRVECLYHEGWKDIDPHGMFEYVGFELYPEEAKDDCNYNWEPLILKIKNKEDV